MCYSYYTKLLIKGKKVLEIGIARVRRRDLKHGPKSLDLIVFLGRFQIRIQVIYKDEYLKTSFTRF